MKPAGILLGLWIGWLLTLAAAFGTGATRDYWWQGARLDMAMVSCLLLAIAAWTAWWSLHNTPVATAMALIAVGMSLGFYGDSHVGDRIWWPPFPHKIIGGIVFYGLGHLAYVTACVLIRRIERLSGGWRWWSPILVWQGIAMIGWACVALTSSEEPGLRVPTLLYTLLVAATPGFATALAVQRPIFRWMALGGALFLVSDILLAWQVFHESFAGIQALTWINYGGGEMLIVYGAIAGLWQHAPAGESDTHPQRSMEQA